MWLSTWPSEESIDEYSTSENNFNWNNAEYYLTQADKLEWWYEKFIPILEKIKNKELVYYCFSKEKIEDEWELTKTYWQWIKLKNWDLLSHNWWINETNWNSYNSIEDYLNNLSEEEKQFHNRIENDIIADILKSPLWKKIF